MCTAISLNGEKTTRIPVRSSEEIMAKALKEYNEQEPDDCREDDQEETE